MHAENLLRWARADKLSRHLDSLPVEGVSLLRGSEMHPEPVSWIWQGWLAAGKLHILAGIAGTGKTTIATKLGATVTTGAQWPDGTQSIAGKVVVWSSEDDPSDTLLPRFIASGGDVSQVFFVSGISERGKSRPFDPARDMGGLRTKLEDLGDVRLLIIDPLVSAVSSDSHKNAEVRRDLQPLADLAASTKCAVLGVSHLSKGTSGREPVERLTGSLAFGALARVVMIASRASNEADGAEMRVFCRAKSNIGPDEGGFEYHVEECELPSHPGVSGLSVVWRRELFGPARELLAGLEDPDRDNAGPSGAYQLLAGLLANGPMPAAEIFRDAEQAGFSKSSIRRAADNLRVDRRKDGMRGGWTWWLPPKVSAVHEDAEDAE
jgi:putative DNA primase/helicase